MSEENHHRGLQMNSRIREGDMFYMGWWFLLMGAVVFFLARIEANTRNHRG